MPRVPGLAVTIAGDGPEAAALAARARARGVDGFVRFVGRLPHAALPALLADAAVVVSCALSDSTSISLLEAMAAGATPVVTDLPGNRAWVEDGVHGRLFPPGDAARCWPRRSSTTLGDPEFRAPRASPRAAASRSAATSRRSSAPRSERHAALAARGVAA